MFALLRLIGQSPESQLAGHNLLIMSREAGESPFALGHYGSHNLAKIMNLKFVHNKYRVKVNNI